MVKSQKSNCKKINIEEREIIDDFNTTKSIIKKGINSYNENNYGFLISK